MQQPQGIPPPQPTQYYQPQQQQQQPFTYPQQQQQQPQQQQPWMMQQPMWNQQIPQHQYHIPQQQQNQNQYQQGEVGGGGGGGGGGVGGGGDEVRTLWIGNLQFWMDENYITNAFINTGEVVGAKVIRNKQTQQSEGYGFIEFRSHAAAEKVLQAFNNTLMPQADQNFRLNWASYGAGERHQDESTEYTVFVGDLSHEVTDYALLETFKAGYPSVKGAKVVTDRLTGRSKGYGFVRFSDESEQKRAMDEMNGVTLANRPMRTGPAASKKNSGTTASYQNTQGTMGDSDPNNTTIFVGNLATNATEEHLTQLFGQYGELTHVKIPLGRRCGFVQFASRSNAEAALQGLHGTQLGGQNIRLSWGHNSSNKQELPTGLVQPQVDPNQWAGYYGFPQAYGSYGYAAGGQDPNMYQQAYQGYGNYAVPQPHQQAQQQQ